MPRQYAAGRCREGVTSRAIDPSELMGDLQGRENTGLFRRHSPAHAGAITGNESWRFKNRA